MDRGRLKVLFNDEDDEEDDVPQAFQARLEILCLSNLSSPFILHLEKTRR